MRVGTQFLVAVRLLCTVRNLSARLTITSGNGSILVYASDGKILLLESSQNFPASWFSDQGHGGIAAALHAAGNVEARLQAVQPVIGNNSLAGSFRDASRNLLKEFFQQEIRDCKLKQEPMGDHAALMTVPEAFFECARTFLLRIPSAEMLPSREIPFLQSADCMQRSSGFRLGPEDGFLLSRLEQPLSVTALLSSVPGDEENTIAGLLSLWAFGLLDSPILNQMVPKVDTAKAPPPAAPRAEKPAPAKAPEPFEEETPEQLARMVADTYASLSRKDFYSVLGLSGQVDLVEIKAAYYKLARKFHPDRFYGSTDPVLKEKVDVIFSAVNVAYETLKNSKRRLEYDNTPKEKRVIGTTSLNTQDTVTELSSETINKVAEDHSRRAQKCYEEGSYYQAVQFLRSATQIAPGVAKYWRQLGISLSRNPQWRKEAEESFQRAMDLEPRNPENHLYLGFLYKNAGLKIRAKKHFQTCRDMDPLNEIAAREYRLLEGEEESEKDRDQAGKKGLLGGIFKKK